MKTFTSVAFLAAAVSALATVNISSTAFAKAVGTKFDIGGVPKYFAGTNCYWCSFLTNNSDVDLVLNNIASSGLKVVRIWGFNDVNTIPDSGTVWFQHLSALGSTINTGPTGLQRLDYVVSAAAASGLKLIINFVNNWDDYGGISSYVRAFGGSKSSWYTNSAAQTQYRAYIKAVVSRYKDSEAVFAWELANEPRCSWCSTDVIYDWASKTSSYIKSLDPGHMVTLGDEGFGLSGDWTHPYWFIEGLDWARNLAIPTIDFGTFHLYPETWVTNWPNWGNNWIKAHADLCVKANKPCLMEEYGMKADHCGNEAPWQKASRFTDGMAGDLFWQWGDTISTGQSHNDGFTIYHGSPDWTCLVKNHVAAIG